MKKLLLIFFIIILFLIFVWRYNNNPRIIIFRLLRKGDIGTGDLKYRINLLGIIPVGEATFAYEKAEEHNGIKVYHLNASAGILKIFSKLFNGYAILDSYVDREKLSPVLFRQRVEAPGKENPSKEIFYDLKNLTMNLNGVVRQILPNTQDPLSAMFKLRHMDFDNTKEIEMNINTNQKNYILTGIAKQKDLLTNKKIFKIVIIKSEIKRRDKDPYHKSNVTIVLLKGKENIPILIKVFASGALITAQLVDIN